MSNNRKFLYILFLSGAILATPMSALLLRSGYKKTKMKQESDGKRIDYHEYNTGIFNKSGIQSDGTAKDDNIVGGTMGICALFLASGAFALRRKQDEYQY